MESLAASIKTYEDACLKIKEIGILPLFPSIPNYPSLEALTEKEHWHSGTELCPWDWRTRFAHDGIAAYGKFFKKKAFFIAREWFPAMLALRSSHDHIEERYERGTVSKSMLDLYQLIEAQPGIDTRELRKQAGMREKEKKRDFDGAIVSLQESFDIVISGTKFKLNEQGEVSGWNSTRFELATHWMPDAKLPTLEEAKSQLQSHLGLLCDESAYKAYAKLLQL